MSRRNDFCNDIKNDLIGLCSKTEDQLPSAVSELTIKLGLSSLDENYTDKPFIQTFLDYLSPSKYSTSFFLQYTHHTPQSAIELQIQYSILFKTHFQSSPDSLSILLSTNQFLQQFLKVLKLLLANHRVFLEVIQQMISPLRTTSIDIPRCIAKSELFDPIPGILYPNPTAQEIRIFLEDEIPTKARLLNLRRDIYTYIGLPQFHNDNFIEYGSILLVYLWLGIIFHHGFTLERFDRFLSLIAWYFEHLSVLKSEVPNTLSWSNRKLVLSHHKIEESYHWYGFDSIDLACDIVFPDLCDALTFLVLNCILNIPIEKLKHTFLQTFFNSHLCTQIIILYNTHITFQFIQPLIYLILSQCNYAMLSQFIAKSGLFITYLPGCYRDVITPLLYAQGPNFHFSRLTPPDEVQKVISYFDIMSRQYLTPTAVEITKLLIQLPVLNAPHYTSPQTDVNLHQTTWTLSMKQDFISLLMNHTQIFQRLWFGIDGRSSIGGGKVIDPSSRQQLKEMYTTQSFSSVAQCFLACFAVLHHNPRKLYNFMLFLSSFDFFNLSWFLERISHEIYIQFSRFLLRYSDDSYINRHISDHHIYYSTSPHLPLIDCIEFGNSRTEIQSNELQAHFRRLLIPKQNQSVLKPTSSLIPMQSTPLPGEFPIIGGMSRQCWLIELFTYCCQYLHHLHSPPPQYSNSLQLVQPIPLFPPIRFATVPSRFIEQPNQNNNNNNNNLHSPLDHLPIISIDPSQLQPIEIDNFNFLREGPTILFDGNNDLKSPLNSLITWSPWTTFTPHNPLNNIFTTPPIPTNDSTSTIHSIPNSTFTHPGLSTTASSEELPPTTTPQTTLSTKSTFSFANNSAVARFKSFAGVTKASTTATTTTTTTSPTTITANPTIQHNFPNQVQTFTDSLPRDYKKQIDNILYKMLSIPEQKSPVDPPIPIQPLLISPPVNSGNKLSHRQIQNINDIESILISNQISLPSILHYISRIDSVLKSCYQNYESLLEIQHQEEHHQIQQDEQEQQEQHPQRRQATQNLLVETLGTYNSCVIFDDDCMYMIYEWILELFCLHIIHDDFQKEQQLVNNIDANSSTSNLISDYSVLSFSHPVQISSSDLLHNTAQHQSPFLFAPFPQLPRPEVQMKVKADDTDEKSCTIM